MTDRQPRTLSQALVDTCEQLPSPALEFGALTTQLGTRAYGSIIVLLTIPNLFPGLSTIGGVLLLIYALQMALNMPTPWLPKLLADIKIEKKWLAHSIEILLPKLDHIEHFIKPRWTWFSSPLGLRLAGVCISLFAIAIMIPLPFTNFWPAIATLFVAFGMLQKDGLLIAASLLFGLVYCLGLFYFLSILTARLLG